MQNCHTILFYLPIIQLTVYKRTITRFIADDKVAYQRVRRATRLASDNSWARRRLKHVSWRSRWIILCTFEWGMPVSCEISGADRCLFGLSSWHSEHKILHCYMQNAAWTTDSLQQTVNVSRFPTLVRKFIQQPSCTVSLWQTEILKSE